MKQRRLGRSGLVVSEICMGTMTFGSMADEAASLRILDKALDAGVNFIDVAEMYPVPPHPRWVGRSEEICGKWLKQHPAGSVVVATKVAGPLGGWFEAPVRNGLTALDRHHIERAVEGSLQRLGVDTLDLYQTHWPDPGLPLDETMEALDRMVEEGKVRYVGCSNQSAYGLSKSLWVSDKLSCARNETIQNNFSVLNRRFEDALAEVCRAEQVSLLPYSPLAGGVLSGKYQGGAWPEGARFTRYREDPRRGATMAERFVNEQTLGSVEKLAQIAEDHEMSVATLAVAWTLSHDYVGSTIIGATHPDQLDDTLAAAQITLSPEVLATCDAVSREFKYPMG